MMKKSPRKIRAVTFATVAAALGLMAVAASPGYAQEPPIPLSVPGEIVLRVPNGMDEPAARKLAEAAGCELIGQIAYSPHFYLVRVKSSGGTGGTGGAGILNSIADAKEPTQAVRTAVAQLRKTPGVLADPNLIKKPVQTVGVTPNDPRFGEMWNLQMMKMPLAWARQFGARPATLAVFDTGFDVGHPDFERNGARIYRDPMNFINPVAPTPDVTDTNGHGTHVSGSAVGVTNNATGIAGVAGYDGGGVRVTLVPIKGGDFGFSSASIIAGLNYCVAQGVDVVNMSLAGYFRADTEEAAITSAINSGVVVVAAASNENVNMDLDVYLPDGQPDQTYPAGYPGVISVGAVGSDKVKASYSNYGSTVTIAAPGGDDIDGPPATSLILSTYPRAINPSGYDYSQGTSMASPHVAGVVALLVAAGVPKGQIAQVLQETAEDISALNPGTPIGGLVDPAEAILRYSDPDPAVFLVGGLDRGASYNRNFPINLAVIGVKKLPQATLTVRIETATIPTTVVRSFTAGVDFPLPTLEPGELAATLKTISLPITPALSEGRYKVVATLTYNNQTSEQQIQFFEVVQKQQQLGRSMFSVPFRVPLVDPQNPEKTLLGAGVAFRLRRYDPTQPNGGSEPGAYFTFASNGQPADRFASFLATGSDNLPLTYDPANPTMSLAPLGMGYWLDLEETRPLNTVGPRADFPVAIRLFADNGGWNMIGAPFTAPVDWSSVSVEVGAVVGTERLSLADAINRNIISPVLVSYRDGEYVYSVAPNGTLEPFQGYWVRALENCTLIVSPPAVEATPSRSRAQNSGLPAMKGWRARISASVAGDRDGQNYFGQLEGAAAKEDRFDIPKPPAGAGHAYVRFIGETEAGRAASLAYDMRAPGQNRQEWTVAVSTDRDSADVTLSWDGISSAPRRSRLILKDTETGQVIPMNSRSSFTFKSGEAGTTRLFKIVLEPQLSAGPLQILNLTTVNTGKGSGRATGAGAMNVRFTVNQDADVQATVRTLSGKPIATLTGTGRATGMKETILRWDGRSQGGGAVPFGPYVLEVTARTASGETTTVKRAIQFLR